MNTDILSIILKGTDFSEVSTKEITEQIEAKSRCKNKLPTWFNKEGIYYPNKLNIEQTSSETTAGFKSGLISGKSLIDLTGGFGVDDYFFARNFDLVVHCEINGELSEIVEHNYRMLGIENIKCINTDGLLYLGEADQKFDWIYIDPSRRSDSKGKVFLLQDCLPNVPENLDLLFDHADNIMIKTSPLLDLSIGLSELGSVESVHIVALNNEVKELLWILKKDFSGNTTINTVNLGRSSNEHFSFDLHVEKTAIPHFAPPAGYLYEPNAAIMKSGGFNIISEKLKLKKLHQHSHLYSSDAPIDFPGRCFKIEEVIPFNKKQLKKRFQNSKANITTRNFPERVEAIRNSLKINDGGDIYLFFTTDMKNDKIVLLCKKYN